MGRFFGQRWGQGRKSSRCLRCSRSHNGCASLAVTAGSRRLRGASVLRSRSRPAHSHPLPLPPRLFLLLLLLPLSLSHTSSKRRHTALSVSISPSLSASSQKLEADASSLSLCLSLDNLSLSLSLSFSVMHTFPSSLSRSLLGCSGPFGCTDAWCGFGVVEGLAQT